MSMVRKMGYGLGIAALTVLVACGPSPEEVAKLKSQQEDILSKLGELDKKLVQVAAARRAPAPPRQPQVDPNKVYDLPVGGSPVHGPAAAQVAIVEFADFQ